MAVLAPCNICKGPSDIHLNISIYGDDKKKLPVHLDIHGVSDEVGFVRAQLSPEQIQILNQDIFSISYGANTKIYQAQAFRTVEALATLDKACKAQK